MGAGFGGLSRTINAMKAATITISAPTTKRVKLSIVTRYSFGPYDSGLHLNCEAARFIRIFDAKLGVTFGQFILTNGSEICLDQLVGARSIFGLYKDANLVQVALRRPERGYDVALKRARSRSLSRRGIRLPLAAG